MCQCPTCQKPNEALRKAAQARAHARLLKVQRQTHNPDVIVATARSIFPAPSMSAAAVGEDLSEVLSPCFVRMFSWANSTLRLCFSLVMHSCAFVCGRTHVRARARTYADLVHGRHK